MISHSSIFAILYCLIFFNPLHLNNEIWPFFVLGILLKNKININHLIIMFAYLIISCGVSILFDFLPLIEIIQFFIILLTCSYISSLENNHTQNICKIFKSFLIISLFFGICQFVIPGLQEATYDIFSGRASLTNHLLNDRIVVTFFSPEPSYASAHFFSMFLFLAVNNKLNKKDILIFLTLILMTRSLSTILVLPFLIILLLQINIFKFKYILSFTITSLIASLIFLEKMESIFWRLIDFIEAWLATGSIIEAEQALESVRIGQILATVFVFTPEFFQKPYSFFGYLNMTTMLPFSWFLLCLLIIFHKRIFLILNSTIILALMGPILMAMIPASIVLSLKKENTRKSLK